jgi:hypothetical protein
MFKKYLPLLSVIAPLLIFLNWIIDTSFVKKADATKETMDKLWSERWIYISLNTIIGEQKNQAQILSSFGQSKDTIPGFGSKWAKQFVQMTDEFSKDENFSYRLADLVKFSWQTKDLAEQIGLDEEFSEKIELVVDSVYVINNSVLESRSRWSNTMNKLFGAGVSGRQVDSAKLSILRDSLQPYKRALKEFSNDYLKYDNQLLQINSDLYDKAKVKARDSRIRAARYSYLAIFIYVLGSLLAIVGKWVEIKEKQKKAATAFEGAPPTT